MLNNIRDNQYKTVKELTSYIKQIPIESVVERLGIQLQSIGSNLQGQCPTGHPSKNGRCFTVNTKNNYFFCFSCNIGGSNIDLVIDVKQYSFSETIEWFTKEFGITHSIQLKHNHEEQLTEEEKKERGLVIARAAFYEPSFEWMHNLLFEEEGKEALEYLVNERKYDLDTLRKSDFCYFPAVPRIREYLRQQFPDGAEMINGLSFNGGNGDNFRVAFPYRNMDGNITGFVKRATAPKGLTINGEENVRWDSTKGVSKKDLFNLFHTKKEETLLIVEGYPDALYFTAMGMKNIVAVGQGRLSESHLKGLQNTNVKNIIISFDNDEVGPKNSRDAVSLILNESKITPFVLDPNHLNPHKDPDEFVKANGLDSFQLLMNKCESGIIWLAKQIISECNLESQLSKQGAVEKLLGFFSFTKNEIDKSALADLMCKELKIEKAVLNKMIKSHNDKVRIETYNKIKNSNEVHRFLPFIEKATSSYSYYDSKEDDVYLGVPKEILENILLSAEQTLPEVLPILKADFYVMMNERYDLENEKFNFFVPTKYMLLEKNDRVIDSFPSIERLLVNLIPKPEERLRFINWLAGILQTRQKQQTAWVFKGKPGAGKGLMLDHILKPLFGSKQAIKVEDAQLNNDFNPWLQNALLIAFNEVAHDNNTRNSINSKVKAIITDSEVIINEKNIRNYTITNYVNCLFFSNEEVPVFIEQGDRRFNVVVTGGNLREKDWFNNPDGFIQKLEEEVPYFAQFLMNWDYDKIAAMTCIENDDKQLMVGAAMNKFEEFALHLKNEDVDWFEENSSPLLQSHYCNLDGKILKSSALKLFADIYSSYLTTDIELGKKLKLYGVESVRDRKGGADIKYYAWRKNELK